MANLKYVCECIIVVTINVVIVLISVPADSEVVSFWGKAGAYFDLGITSYVVASLVVLAFSRRLRLTRSQMPIPLQDLTYKHGDNNYLNNFELSFKFAVMSAVVSIFLIFGCHAIVGSNDMSMNIYIVIKIIWISIVTICAIYLSTTNFTKSEESRMSISNNV